jgi:hypothetical protein
MYLFFYSNQLLQNPYPYWKVIFSKILLNQKAILLFNAKDSEENNDKTRQDIASLYDVPKGCIRSDISIEVQEESFLFDFGLSEFTYPSFKSSSKTVGFIGFDDDINSKLSYYREKKSTLIISEILPHELPHEISEENLEYFINFHYFLPPTKLNINLQKSKEKRILIFHNSTKNSSSSKNTSVLNALKGSDKINIIDISDLSSFAKIDGSKGISDLANPQANHSLRLASPFEIQELNSNTEKESPLRNLYFKSLPIKLDKPYEQKSPSFRQKIITCLHHDDPEEFVTNYSPAYQTEDEIKFLLSALKGQSIHLRQKICLPITNIAKVPESIFPNWITHFATEPTLHQLFLKEKQLRSENCNDINTEFVPFIEEYLYFIHLVDYNNIYISHLRDLCAKPEIDSLDTFDRIASCIVKSFGTKTKETSEMHSNLVYKFVKLEFAGFYIHQNSSLNKETIGMLLNFLEKGKKFCPDGISPDMTKVQLLCMSNRYEEALDICSNNTSVSSANILYSILGLCAALSGDTKSCTKALESYQPTESQNAHHYVSIAYLVTRLYVPKVENDQHLNILKTYKSHNIKSSWWQTELMAMAIVRAVPADKISTAVLQSKEFLVNSGSLSTKDVQRFHSMPCDLPFSNLLNDLIKIIDKDD